MLPIVKNTNVIAPGLYKVHTKPNQTRTPQLHQDIRKPNKRVSFSTGVIPNTRVSRPQLKSNHLEDRVMSNNSQGKKQEVEDHRRKFKFSNNKTSVTACNDSLNAKTSNVNFVCVTCGKCVLNENHDLALNHNLFSVASILCKCDADLEVAFRKSTCYICDLKGNDLLTGSRGTDLYSISLQDSTTPNPICLMAKATSSQAWLWHLRLSYLNFDTINLLSKINIVNGLLKLKFIKDHLCSSCELGKAKIKSFHTKTTPSSKRRLQLLHMDLCGPMRVESINGKKYVLVIIDAYSDNILDSLLEEILNKTLHAFFIKEGIRHETSTARTPEQNGIVERQNRTLVEADRTQC
ncbi:retrovirus-related pol polyprotein from transposon TNT 1-94 [Tanacetum coccineum]